MRNWVLYHCHDGYAVELVRVRWWALAISHGADAVDSALGHLLCRTRFGHSALSWAFALEDAHAVALYRCPVSVEEALALGWVPYEDEEL